jgi:hypothetical protein
VPARSLSFIVLAALVVGAGSTHSHAQESLGEVARRDKERQQRAPKPAKRYTADDLRQSGTPAAPEAPSPAASATPSAEPSSLDSEREERRLLEEKWRKRFHDARQRIKEAESRAWQEVIRPVLVGGSASGMLAGKAVYVPMLVREFVETEELRQARKALEDLEEELRRAGLPPGWGRDK